MRLGFTPAQFWEFVRYSIVGSSSAAIEYGLLWLLIRVLAWHPLVANPIAFILSVTNGFTWNRCWTFKGARREAPIGQYARFVLVNIGALLLDEGVLAAALVLGPFCGLTRDWSVVAGKLAAIPLIVTWNFTANLRWTFGRRHCQPVEAPASVEPPVNV